MFSKHLGVLPPETPGFPQFLPQLWKTPGSPGRFPKGCRIYHIDSLFAPWVGWWFRPGALSPHRESNEAHVSAKSPSSSAGPRVSGSHAHQEWPVGAQAPPRQGSQAPDRFLELTPVRGRVLRPGPWSRICRSGSDQTSDCARARSSRSFKRPAAGLTAVSSH